MSILIFTPEIMAVAKQALDPNTTFTARFNKRGISIWISNVLVVENAHPSEVLSKLNAAIDALTGGKNGN